MTGLQGQTMPRDDSAPLITMIVPVYNQPGMLRRQFETWADYGMKTRAAFHFTVVDDCSKNPVEVNPGGWPDVSLYRIDKDVPWNRGMARNLGTKMATTPWVLHVDTDHVLPAEEAAELVWNLSALSINHWYRFCRYRVGAADETRKKDKIPPGAKFGEIHPHIDSYLCTPAAYWKAGGYNESFSGVLGGGTPFLKEMTRVNGEATLAPVALHVHTRDSVPDSSEHTLPRDPKAFKQRKHEIMAAFGTLRGDPKTALRLPWHRVL